MRRKKLDTVYDSGVINHPIWMRRLAGLLPPTVKVLFMWGYYESRGNITSRFWIHKAIWMVFTSPYGVLLDAFVNQESTLKMPVSENALNMVF